MGKLREGDLLLQLKENGGDITIVNGEPQMDGGFESYVQICIMGNSNDLWFADEYMTENQKFKGEFNKFTSENPKTSSNLLIAEALLQNDLQSLIDEKIADKINIELFSIDHIRLEVQIEILKNQATIFENQYQINWLYQSGGINGA